MMDDTQLFPTRSLHRIVPPRPRAAPPSVILSAFLPLAANQNGVSESE
jgi:hypothetical protein